MKPASLLVFAQGLKAVPQPLQAAFEAQLSERDEPLDTIKEHEARSVIRLVDDLLAHGATDPRAFEGFAFSFRIPQISSEFDLLKVTDRAVVNIELKIEDVGSAKIERQLTRNRYYLAPLERALHTFTYVADAGALYELDDDGHFGPASLDQLAALLSSAGTPYDGRLESLFKVSNYLVSPLNDTERFLEGSYFLTNHQAQIKAAFLRACADEGPDGAPAFLVYGSAGTGKSLLLYDIARSLQLTRPVCVIHCGVLSEGHEALNQAQEGFHIISAKGMEHQSLDGYAALLVDEAQRLWPSQLRRIVETAVLHDLPLYLSLGRRQVTSLDSVSEEAEAIVRASHHNVTTWELSRKIRTNKELADFIRALFGMRGHPRVVRTHSVKVSCAQDAAAAQELVRAFCSEGYQYLSYGSPSAGTSELDDFVEPGSLGASSVIGQEFDRVVMVVGPRFSQEDGQLYRQLLFQGLTRARDQIALVVHDNDELLAQLLAILAG